MRNNLIVACAAVLAASQALSLQSDNSKPIEIAADHFSGDQVSQTAVYTGRVEVHQGTLEMHGDKLDLRINKKGYRTGVLTGKLAKAKQQRDNPDPKISEWVHAEAETIIYDEEKDTVTLITNARLTRTENGTMKDEATGQRITYNMRNSRSEALSGTVDGERQRVTTLISPRKNTARGGAGDDTAKLHSSPAPTTRGTRK